MASLSDKLKAFVVIELACFARPSEIREQLEKRGVSVGLDQVMYYDPTTRAQKKPAEKWVALFKQARADYLASELAVAIANRRWRLDQLQRIHDATKSPKLQMEAMERAAKEVGDGYTNTQKLRHTGKDDDTPIQTQARVVVGLPDNGRGDRAPGALSPAGGASAGGRTPPPDG